MEIAKKIKAFFTLTSSEGRGVLVLVPLLAIAGVLIHGLGRPESDPGFLSEADSIELSAGRFPDPGSTATREDSLFFFDPNTATLEEFCALGFELRTAAGIVKYRNAGKVFEVPEDLAMCYGVTLQQYLSLEPYIKIGEPYRRKIRTGRPDSRIGASERKETRRTVGAKSPFDPNELDAEGFMALGFTAAQAGTILSYRTSVGGFTTAEQFGRCYAVTAEALANLEPYMVFKSGTAPAHDGSDGSGTVDAPVLAVEINSADSAALRSVSGIGEVLVVRIMEYRSRLGGFHSLEQLAEVRGMTAANYERIIEQITVDSCIISKIDINFAAHKDLVALLEKHPYTHARMTRKLLSVRQLKGGWSNTQELVEDKILTQDEARKLAPYLLFKPLQTKE
ncbi:MAG: helix-hairpin-helix domain-containing protein [Rikenellaceae bacterium]|nr:helix-hairpin-helix domain-containing protein [Rikenellaceae bacterium]